MILIRITSAHIDQTHLGKSPNQVIAFLINANKTDNNNDNNNKNNNNNNNNNSNNQKKKKKRKNCNDDNYNT